MKQQPTSTNPSPNPSGTAFLQDSSLMIAPQQPLGGGDRLPVSLPFDQNKIRQQPTQLAVAEEAKRRLEAEKQAEIERIKQQHAAELKRAQKDFKYESPVQPLKSTPPLPPMSQIIQQTISAPPKLKATPEQLALQDKLIAACEQGDEKAVTALLKQGAKPDVAGTPDRFSPGKQPLGAAVWGMCPDVVNALLKQAGGVAP